VALGIVAAVGVLAYRAAVQRMATERWIAHAHEAAATVDAAVGQLKDAEIAVRAYLVTADEDLVARRELSRATVARTLAALRAAVADDFDLRPQAETLDTMIRAQFAYSDDVLRHRATRALPSAELNARLAEATRRLDEIAGLAAQVQHAERRVLAALAASAEARTQRALTGLAGGIVVGVSVIAAVLALLDREVRRRRQAEDQLAAGRHAQMGLRDLDVATAVSHGAMTAIGSGTRERREVDDDRRPAVRRALQSDAPA
jgi:CHASE3 domain sensor protein